MKHNNDTNCYEDGEVLAAMGSNDDAFQSMVRMVLVIRSTSNS